MTNQEADAMLEKWSAWCKEHDGNDLRLTYHAEPDLYDNVAIVIMKHNHIVAVYTSADYFDEVRSYSEEMVEAQQPL